MYQVKGDITTYTLTRSQLYQLYVNPANAGLVHDLYIKPCSSNIIVQLAIARQLREAATEELAKSSFSGVVSEEDIFRDAENALSTLAELLSSSDWFFGQAQPSILDASIFAYTHLILDGSLQWSKNKLAEQLSQHANLSEHRSRILNRYF